MFVNHLLSASLDFHYHHQYHHNHHNHHASAAINVPPPAHATKTHLRRCQSSWALANNNNNNNNFSRSMDSSSSTWLTSQTMLQRVNAGRDIDNSRQNSSQPPHHHQHHHHHHHHFRPLSFRCKTAEMLNLVTVEDGARARTKSVGASAVRDQTHQNKNKNSSWFLYHNHLAQPESLTSSSLDISSSEDEEEEENGDGNDKTHYEDVLNSLGESFLKNFESDDWSLSDITDDEEHNKQEEVEEEFCEDYLEIGKADSYEDRKDKLLRTMNLLGLRSVSYTFDVHISRLHICWHEPVPTHGGDHGDVRYRLCLYLLNKHLSDYRDHPGHLLAPPLESRSIDTRQVSPSLDNPHKVMTLTDIYFGGDKPEDTPGTPTTTFITSLHLPSPSPDDNIDATCFETKVVRLELERYRTKSAVGKQTPGGVHHNHQTAQAVGFVDVDLASVVANGPYGRACAPNQKLPFVLLGTFNDKMNKRTKRRQRASQNRGNLCLDLHARFEARPLVDEETLAEEAWLLAKPEQKPEQARHQPELEYHKPRSHVPLYRHLLNVLGLSPPGSLYRISLHFGRLEHLILPATVSSIYACFEVHNSGHPHSLGRLKSAASMAVLPFLRPVRARSTSSLNELDPLAHHQLSNIEHHETRKICCRTRRLESCCFGDDECGNFDQHFTFYERFLMHHTPHTSLVIRSGDRGRKLYTYQAPLIEFLDCASAGQYFHLSGRKSKLLGGVYSDQHCRLQFSITVQLVQAG